MWLKDFPKKSYKKAISDTLRYQQSAGKVKEDNESGIKLYFPCESVITGRISRLAKRFNIKVVNTNTTSLKQKMITKTMNQKSEMEI